MHQYARKNIDREKMVARDHMTAASICPEAVIRRRDVFILRDLVFNRIAVCSITESSALRPM